MRFSFWCVFRQNMGNGTMFFPPFRGTEYRPEVHDAVYRCRAESSAGVMLSRNVNIRAGEFLKIFLIVFICLSRSL
jgi:hypothetical protein